MWSETESHISFTHVTLSIRTPRDTKKSTTLRPFGGTGFHYESALELGTRWNPLDEVVDEVRDREQVIMENKGIWPSRSGDQMCNGICRESREFPRRH